MVAAETLAATADRQPQLFGHPRGLTALFATQMWAEFSFFGLQALLVYYMTKHLGFSQAQSSLIYGAYGAAAFFSPFIGGAIADRWLGRTRSVILGGLLMMFGHFAMAWEGLLFAGLALVAVGNGLFIPPLAVQVGGLYGDDDPRKASAYSAYYMGINLGGLTAPLVCGTLGELYGWHWGFGAAGVGMAIGLIIYCRSLHLLPPEPKRTARVRVHASDEPAAVGKKLKTLLLMIAMIILFRVGYEQSGNVIALWVADRTDRSIAVFGSGLTIPATWFQAFNPLLIVLATPFLIRGWNARKKVETVGHLLRRMSFGCLVAGIAMLVMVGATMASGPDGARVSAYWVLGYFVLLTMGELLVIPVGLTLVETLSPARFAATAMGGWYIAKFAGSLFAGIVGAYWGKIDESAFFGISAVAPILAALLLLSLGRSHEKPAKVEFTG